MGQKSRTATVVAIFQAFLERRKWTQPGLARRVKVGVPALKRRLEELRESGFPIVQDARSPQDVWWSVPKDWYPDAVLLKKEDVRTLLRQLSRLPRSAERDQMIQKVVENAPRPSVVSIGEGAVLAPRSTENEQTFLPLVEDAARSRTCLEFKYFTASRGDLHWRRASVHRVLVGPPARFIAVCHEAGGLKWFRLDCVQNARLDREEPFRRVTEGQIEAMLSQSVDGYHRDEPVLCSFFVRDPDARWVEHNLPVSIAPEKAPGGMRFTTTTAGVLPLARFVVGLGAAARAETPKLAELVEELAQGALSAPSVASG
jgi:predicted DNA-binding transcriptional regulator YafY